jgi:hypothetical protein
MTVKRGSTSGLYGIKEVTYGVTPATPTLVQFPFVNWNPTTAHTVLTSAQIRSHPYVDRVLAGRTTFTHALDVELQPAVHDALIETCFGGVITSKVLKHADVLKSMTMEERTDVSGGLFNQFSGVYWNRIDVSASASDTAPVSMKFAGMSLAGTLDATSTIATAVTAAAAPDPYIFADASLGVSGSPVAVVSGNFTIDRTVDPLMLWGSRLPREYVPGAVTASGSITVPYDDGIPAGVFTGFADTPLAFKFTSSDATTFRRFTFPRTRYVSLGRQINTRAGLMQVINWQAMYDTTTATVCSMDTE